MNLDIAWSTPAPSPTCGYKALYRRRADPTYTEVDTSGTTLVIPVSSPASYEGKVVCDCCSESVSAGVAFGVNAYSLVSASAVLSNGQLSLTVSSAYGNPYDTLVTGSITVMVNSSPVAVPYTVTYPRGKTSNVFPLGAQAGTTVSATTITALAPVFANNGQLQELDPIRTPPYFKFYYAGQISGNTWGGSPASLPSFTLDQFNVTETSVDGTTVLAGQLLFSYILGAVFPNSFTNFTIEVFDPAAPSVPIGSVILSKTPLGLRSESILLNKSASPLTSATQFTMKVYWPDNTLFDTKQFYLPS